MSIRGQIPDSVESLLVHETGDMLGQEPGPTALQNRRIQIRNPQTNQQGRQFTPQSCQLFGSAHIGNAPWAYAKLTSRSRRHCSGTPPGGHQVVFPLDLLQFGVEDHVGRQRASVSRKQPRRVEEAHP